MQTTSINAQQIALLETACQELCLEPTEKQKEQLLEYITLLMKWNQTYNLTAIKDPNQALIQHVFDSLSVIPPIKKYISLKKIQEPEMLDVGSGAGLPGLVIALMIPEARVTCVDPVEKKMTFIRQVAGIFNLVNIKTQHERVENIKTGPFDIVTSRAFASLEDFADLAGYQVKNDGVLVAMKGKKPQEEIEVLEKNTLWKVELIETLTVPQLDAHRCLVWMRKKGTV